MKESFETKTRNEEEHSFASGAKAVTQSQADGKKSKASKANGEQRPMGSDQDSLQGDEQ